MYHAACKVEFQLFHRSYSQLTFFSFFNVSHVPRSLQSWVSTNSIRRTHSWRFSCFYKKLIYWKTPAVSTTNGWLALNFLQAAWCVRRAHWARLYYVPFVIWCLWSTSTIWLLMLNWARLYYVPFVIWCLWSTSTIWLLMLSSTSFMVGRSRVFYTYSSWDI